MKRLLLPNMIMGLFLLISCSPYEEPELAEIEITSLSGPSAENPALSYNDLEESVHFSGTVSLVGTTGYYLAIENVGEVGLFTNPNWEFDIDIDDSMNHSGLQTVKVEAYFTTNELMEGYEIKYGGWLDARSVDSNYDYENFTMQWLRLITNDTYPTDNNYDHGWLDYFADEQNNDYGYVISNVNMHNDNGLLAGTFAQHAHNYTIVDSILANPKQYSGLYSDVLVFSLGLDRTNRITRCALTGTMEGKLWFWGGTVLDHLTITNFTLGANANLEFGSVSNGNVVLTNMDLTDLGVVSGITWINAKITGSTLNTGTSNYIQTNTTYQIEWGTGNTMM